MTLSANARSILLRVSKPDSGCLLSEGVTVVRGSENNGYPFLNESFTISVISCAAVHKPQLTNDRQYKSQLERDRMMTKVKTILKTAVMARCHVVVLGAFGCGSFGNPPEVVAELFRDALTSPDFAALSEVIFAIFDDHNTKAKHNPRGNFAPFEEILAAKRGHGEPDVEPESKRYRSGGA